MLRLVFYLMHSETCEVPLGGGIRIFMSSVKTGDSRLVSSEAPLVYRALPAKWRQKL